MSEDGKKPDFHQLKEIKFENIHFHYPSRTDIKVSAGWLAISQLDIFLPNSRLYYARCWFDKDYKVVSPPESNLEEEVTPLLFELGRLSII